MRWYRFVLMLAMAVLLPIVPLQAGGPSEGSIPPGFWWGTVLSTHSVEGGHQNNWTAWEAVPGHIADGRISGMACNHWELFSEDQKWMKELGQNAVIVSLEWSRIEPQPRQYDQAAIDHYRSMLKSLRSQGIEPVVVLWDRTLPAWVASYGGLEAPAIILDFADYSKVVAKNFGDLVDVFVPLRDPVGAVDKAYKLNINPPGKCDLAACAKSLVVLLAMHRGAREAILANDLTAVSGKKPAEVGIIAGMRFTRPNRPDNPMDVGLARANAGISSFAFVDALLKGDLALGTPPQPGPKGFGKLPTNQQPTPPNYDHRVADFIVVQYEGLEEIRFNLLMPLFTEKVIPPGASLDGAGQVIFADGLSALLASLARYPVPLMVMVTAADSGALDRGAFLKSHAQAVKKALGQGVNIRGFFYDSLLCGFDYERGFATQRGLLRVNYPVQERSLAPGADAFKALAIPGAEDDSLPPTSVPGGTAGDSSAGDPALIAPPADSGRDVGMSAGHTPNGPVAVKKPAKKTVTKTTSEPPAARKNRPKKPTKASAAVPLPPMKPSEAY